MEQIKIARVTGGQRIFILLYIVSCVALVPGSMLTIGGGALFGVVRGSIYVSVGATLGATAAFLVGSYLARDWVTRKIGAHPAFAAIDQAVADEGWRIVFLTRFVRIFPFFLMNYAYGLTRVSLRHSCWRRGLGSFLAQLSLFTSVHWPTLATSKPP